MVDHFLVKKDKAKRMLPSGSVLEFKNHIDQMPVYSGVSRELRMKGSPNNIFLLHRHNLVVKLANYLNILAYLTYGWSSDKYSLKCRIPQYA